MSPARVPKIPYSQLVKWTLGVAIVAGGFYLLVRFNQVVLLLLAAIILSTAVRPAARWLEQRGMARPVAIALIFAVVGVLIALFVWLTVPVLSQQSAAILPSLNQGYEGLREYLQLLPNILVRRLLVVLPDTLPELSTSAAPIGATDDVLAGTMMQASRILNSLLQLVVIVLLTFSWTLEGERTKQAALLLVPLPKRAEIRQLVQDIETMLGSYLLGQGLLCLIIGIMSFIAYSLIGLPHALLLAIFAGLLEAVPFLGPILGALPAVVVGLSISPTTALWVMLAAAIVQQLENNLLVPRVMNKTIGVRPLVSVLALFAFGSLFGILGALIALPLVAVLQLVFERYFLDAERGQVASTDRTELSVLRYETNQLVQDVRSRLRHKEDEPSAESDELEDEMEAIAVSLEGYLAAQGNGQS